MKRSILPLAAAIAVLAAAPAGATTFCVGAAACDADDTPTLTFQNALNAAKNHNGLDHVKLAAGTYLTAGGFTYDVNGVAGNDVVVTGVPGGGTVLKTDTTSKPNGFHVLDIDGSGTTTTKVSGVRVIAPRPVDGSAVTTGIRLRNATAHDISVVDDGAAPLNASAGINLEHQARLLGGYVTLKGTGAVAAKLGFDAAAHGGKLNAADGVSITGASSLVSGTRVTATDTGVSVRSTAAELDNLVIRMVDAGSTALKAIPIQTKATAVASHLTLVGPGSAGTSGVAAVASFQDASIALDNSIITGFAASLELAQGLLSANASITTYDSNYDDDGIVGYHPDYLEQLARTNHDPAFVNAAAADYRLKGSSQLIEAGRTTPYVNRLWDVDGNSRAVDADGFNGAAPDLGAHEYQAAKPVAAISVSGDHVVGKQLTFSGTQSSDPDGDQFFCQWTFPGGSSVNGCSATRTFAQVGTYTVQLKVADSTGGTDTEQVVVTITGVNEPVPAEPAPEPVPDPEPEPRPQPSPEPRPSSEGEVDRTAPALSGLRVASRLRAGRRSNVRFALTEPAAVQLLIQRRAGGRWRSVRELNSTFDAGAGRFDLRPAMTRRFRAGRYRALVVAVDDAGNRSATARRPFRVTRG